MRFVCQRIKYVQRQLFIEVKLSKIIKKKQDEKKKIKIMKIKGIL